MQTTITKSLHHQRQQSNMEISSNFAATQQDAFASPEGYISPRE
jgi:hypothetical protein